MSNRVRSEIKSNKDLQPLKPFSKNSSALIFLSTKCLERQNSGVFCQKTGLKKKNVIVAAKTSG